MDRSIHSVTGHIGGVSVTVSAKARLKLRRFSRAAGMAAGAGCGLAALIMAAQAVAQSPRWPVITVLAAAGIWTIWRGKKT